MWLSGLPENQDVTGSIPSHAWVEGQVPSERQPNNVSPAHHVSLLLFLPPFPLSKNKFKKS